MQKYDHKSIEKKWQDKWAEHKLYTTREDKDNPKYYVLDMFPYPSGAGLHVGHPKGYIATDVVSRMKMMQGFNVLHPMGWDAFGLPAENFALKNKVHPRISTEQNIKTFKEQLEKLGFTYDWEREINTTDPEFYKWTQWIFLEMFKRGLAYESYEPINWCPSCQTGLANEDLEEGKCERCGSEIEKKPMRQWVLKITEYADRLLNDLEKLPDWEPSIKEMQRNWIGRSNGATVKYEIRNPKSETPACRPPAGRAGTGRNSKFKISAQGGSASGGKNSKQNIEVFTTRPDTLFGCTYLVVAPEHELITNFKLQITNFDEVQNYIENSKKKSTIDRADANKEKTGVKIEGLVAVNPVNDEEIPIFVADYVLPDYGTGAIMAVPGHDSRDWEVAKKYGVEIKAVVMPSDMIVLVNSNNYSVSGKQDANYDRAKSAVTTTIVEQGPGLSDGININSDFLDDLNTKDAKAKIIEWLEENGAGRRAVNYKLKDWVFSRQRYWGEPIPLVYCENCRILTDRYLLENGKVINDLITSGNPKSSRIPLTAGKYGIPPAKEMKMAGEILNPKHPPAGRAGILNSKIKNQKYSLGELLNPGWVADDNLPVELPEVEHYEPSGTGESPLANIKEWVKTKCPKCGGPAKRETNTMPQWAGSSWYYLRYIDPHNDKALADKDKEKYWSPVDLYVGGAEHATRHLIYSRFWHKFLYDIGAVAHDEPFTRLQHVGLILAEDGRKMSKRWGNVINPDEVVEKYGADAMRVYEMFMGPFSQSCAWSTSGLIGARRFLERIHRMKSEIRPACRPPAGRAGTGRNPKSKTCPAPPCGIQNNKILPLLHKTIKKVTVDIGEFKFNTAVSQLMILVNETEKEEAVDPEHYEILLKLLAPFAPHLAEELWNVECKNSIFNDVWPGYDESLIKEEKFELVIQINGKVRDRIEVDAEISEKEAKALALGSEKIKKRLDGETPRQVVYVKGRLVNIVL
jgi:leucyl-tRNA synthetase